jgi:hypothetical protein
VVKKFLTSSIIYEKNKIPENMKISLLSTEKEGNESVDV